MTTPFQRSRRSIIADGVLTQGMVSLVGGAFLAAFALELGAGNFEIGLLAALPAAGQLAQLPAVLILRKVGQRKPVAVVAALLSRLLWLGIAAAPLFLDGSAALGLVSLLVLASAALGSIGGVAWLSWMRDLVPEEVMGRFFSRRMMLANLLAIFLSLGAGFFIDWWAGVSDAPVLGYSLIFGFAVLLGLAGAGFLSRAEEPRAPAPGEAGSGASVLRTLLEPLEDENFRRLMAFSAAWTLAITFAAPFYVIYMLERIGLSMSAVIALAVLSQVFLVILLRFWGRLADRFSNVSVLGASGTILLLAILAWTFTTSPEPHFLTLPLLIGIHAAMGSAMGGITLATGNVGLKLSPRGKAEAYVTSLGVVNSAVAFVAPLGAGVAASFLADKEISAVLNLRDAAREVAVPTITLQGLDFLFLITFLLGIYAMHRLAYVDEEGTVDEKVVFEELRDQILEDVRTVAAFASLRQVVSFPGALRRERVRSRSAPDDPAS